MKNYRRLSGDGSVKVVLSGDSNSPPKTTRRREPPPYNSSPTQEVCNPRAVPFAFLRVHSRFQKNVDTSEPHPKFQKKPVFALIRGLCDSHSDREFSTTAFLPSATNAHGQLATVSSSGLRDLCLCVVNFPIHQNPNSSKKPVSSRKFTFQHSSHAAPEPSNFLTLNLRTKSGTSHQIPQKMPVFPHFPIKTFELPTSRSAQNVDWPTGDSALGNSVVTSPLPAHRSLVFPLWLRRGTGGGRRLDIARLRRGVPPKNKFLCFSATETTSLANEPLTSIFD
jgi:hypothetical protein